MNFKFKDGEFRCIIMYWLFDHVVTVKLVLHLHFYHSKRNIKLRRVNLSLRKWLYTLYDIITTDFDRLNTNSEALSRLLEVYA